MLKNYLFSVISLYSTTYFCKKNPAEEDNKCYLRFTILFLYLIHGNIDEVKRTADDKA